MASSYNSLKHRIEIGVGFKEEYARFREMGRNMEYGKELREKNSSGQISDWILKFRNES